MKNFASRLQQYLLPICLSASLAFTASSAQASVPQARISSEISSAQMTVLLGSQHPLAQARFDSGRLAAGTKLQGISLYFSRTQAQEADLQALLAAQQNPSSAQYHKWLTPDQFATRFGLSDADIAKVQSWLERQGFSIDAIGRGKDTIRFSGSVSQAESAFSTEIHTYSIPTSRGNQTHFAAATALSVPSALAGAVGSIRGLDDFKPHTHLAARRTRIKPNYTLNFDGSLYVFFDPGDIGTVYDVAKVNNSAYTGSGQTITIIGQSAVSTSDLQAFWSAAGITRENPTLTVVPGTGNSTFLADGDEAESDLDLEWSGAIAKGAALNFVYAGSNGNAFDAITYAIDNQIGTIISSSYGDCETDIGQQSLTSLDSYLERGAAQGQTLMSASGDSGSTDCIADANLTLASQQALAVDYPASSQYVTAVGGTQISTANAAYEEPGDGYWATATGSSSTVTGQNSTALKYIPEQAWNESSDVCAPNASTAADAICAGGGGASAFFTKPAWQTGVSGIPTGNFRYVPDIALNAATANPGYIFCTSDQTFWDTSEGQQSSCTQGFLDSSSGVPTTGGGTSFATPIFAGMLALINQQQGYVSGQGLVNQTLYTLASDSSTYASAFHDITTGNNACDISGACSSSTSNSFAAGTGYDEATGLGSIDLYNLAAAWPANSGSTSALVSTTTTITATTATPALNASDNFTITVTAANGSTITSGSISISVDGATAITAALSANGTYVYATTFTTAGSHTIAVKYAGDSTYAASTGTITVNVPNPTSGTGTFTLAATNLTVTQGSAGNSTITVTPAGGYLGTVELSFTTSNDNALANLCYQFATSDSTGFNGLVGVSSAAAVTTQLQLDTNASDCISSAAAARTGKHALRSMHAKSAMNHTPNAPFSNTGKPLAAGIAFAALVLLGFTRRHSKTLRGLAVLLLVASAGILTTACGNSSNSTNISNPAKGTYTITIDGQDTTTATISNTTSFTFTIQ